MSPIPTQTPLVLLVGFLGAGKTTMLRRLIGEARAQWLTPHVVLNDYANAEVDAESLRAELAQVMPITGSCVCCSSQHELLAALAKHEHQARSIFIIETNGTTDAASLLAMLAASGRLEGFSEPMQLSVVDAQRWGQRWEGNELETHQVRTASHLFLSRTDQVSPTRQNEVLRAVAQVNPLAQFVTAGEFITLIATGQVATLAREAGLHSEAEHQAHHYAALALPIPGPVGKGAFVEFLRTLPKQVVRAKGVVRFLEAPGEVWMFQQVEDECEFSFLANEREGLASVLVLVGPSLPGFKLRQALARVIEGGAPL